MSAPSSPPWLLAATRRRISYVDLRISDAERAEVADLLAKHYGDGRLDEAEFNQRLDQAMRARTYKDLGGLFADLPRTDAEGTAEVPARRQHGRRGYRVLFLALVIAVAAAAGHALVWSLTPWAWSQVPWLWLGLLGALVLYATRASRGAP
jgi:hypothetical protein